MTRRAAELPEHEALVAAIVETYGRATESQRAAGRAWYPSARACAETIAAAGQTSDERAVLALAALSPRNPWRWNVADAYACAVAARDARRTGSPVVRPRCTTFGRNVDTALAVLADGAAGWKGRALKVRAFVAAILGDPDSIVVDVWAVRVATRGTLDRVPSDGAYHRLAAAYRDAAERVGETGRDVQAITWLVAQTEGLGSQRVGRHDETFKRGTPAAIIALFS